MDVILLFASHDFNRHSIDFLEIDNLAQQLGFIESSNNEY